ncbi:disulfide oxidoreductase [Roseospira marina]|uniref:Disulfide oxidoreductase n=1 Tax=Roseospira marina TaxID=140057 RepID=A0A5M6II72_9PROT|nr:helicase-related protein [Roseospira marina]KAA5607375.1 disulfide oxidoreductase [Roseospira marina]MBB4312456.1 ATP-dependent RNA helicase SUPV3L1/SUV3 [Roseospira marina]MBB5085528.1 ATP-dependent RNA helicase SUPV3L1/SUV3 [Roseospira marina]
MIPSTDGARVWAVLGPTNTGKTFLAVERMLGYPSGMMGFPLRLLARETYDRVVRAKGAATVALITGEEKIIPPGARYYLCTVESMPVGRSVDFLAIDEIQLCADAERGHVFTDRLLHARGREETMFLGAATMEPLLRRLLPDCLFETRPRFSSLTYTGPRKLTRLPRRSAVVAFSAADVYAIAELVRRQRGGAAVVMGALSPRTRNAQVALYQSGEVDYLVATDAIGMGLNMDVDHVAFAAMEKFDGTRQRALRSTEVAQIAGRAGRYMNDGTFGTTADVGALPTELVDRVEGHQFQAVRQIQWRNSALDFSSVAALANSLNAPPGQEVLRRTRDATDQLALETLTRDEDIRRNARGRAAVTLLWDVCRVPDFRKIHEDSHIRLQSQIFQHLTSRLGRLPPDWIAGHIKRLDSVDGDIHALSDRIASIRVWTYIAHQNDWLSDAEHWRQRTRAIEDRLSDAMHDRLTQRFVDRRTAVLMRKLHDRADLFAVVDRDGGVRVEDHYVGRLEGFAFTPVGTGGGRADKAVLNASQKALHGEIGRRLVALEAAEDAVFTLADDGAILWDGVPVARLGRGPDALRPMVDLPVSDLLAGDRARRARDRLSGWLDRLVARELAPLLAVREGHGLSGAARGLAYQLAEAMGTAPSAWVSEQLATLSAGDRKALARLDVRIGVESVYMPPLLKPESQRLRGLLWAVGQGLAPPPAPPRGRVSFPVNPAEAPTGDLDTAHRVLGFRVLAGRAVRADMLERFAASVRGAVREVPRGQGGEGAVLPGHVCSMLGVSLDDAEALCRALGFRTWRDETQAVRVKADRRRSRGGDANRSESAADRRRRLAKGAARTSDSPFAVLAEKLRA